jgi:hypothetical protein
MGFEASALVQARGVRQFGSWQVENTRREGRSTSIVLVIKGIYDRKPALGRLLVFGVARFEKRAQALTNPRWLKLLAISDLLLGF